MLKTGELARMWQRKSLQKGVPAEKTTQKGEVCTPP